MIYFSKYLNLDKMGGQIEKTTKFSSVLKLILDTYDLVDIWRIRNPNSRKYIHGGKILKKA